MNTSVRGFTLIELLVVIAIIGILSSVVLASLSSARTKGIDASVRSSLVNARAQAELYYDAGNTYAGVCSNSSTGIWKMITAAASANTTIAENALVNPGTSGKTSCHDSASGWAASSPLKATSGSYFCIDSTGTSKVSTSVLAASSVTCP